MLPSRHSFPIEYGETLLEAALRSGIAIEYNCNNGRCGKCKAKLVSGEISDTIASDYVFSQLEKSQNHILLCRCKAGSDIQIEAHEIDSAAEIPEQEINTKVYKIENINNDLIVLQLKTPRNQTLQFLAGQHATLHIDGLSPRNKSIASCPCNAMYLQFHVHRKTKDPFSDYVFNQLKPKQNITVTGPYGDFQFNEASECPAIFIAYNSGFAPIKSLLEHAMAKEKEQALYLYWIVSPDQGHYLENYCKAWLDVEDNFYYQPLTLSLTPGHSANDISLSIGKIMNEIMAHFNKTPHAPMQKADFYLNGPKGSFQHALEYLQQHNVSMTQIHIDTMKRF